MSAVGPAERPVIRGIGRAFCVGAVAVSIPAVIAYALGFEHGVLVLVGALGFFTAGIGLLTLGGPARAPLRAARRWTGLRLGTIALVSAALVPVSYSAGMAYGASWLEWDPQLGTYFYNERPGGSAVIIASLTLCITATALAIASAVAAVVGAARRRSSRDASP